MMINYQDPDYVHWGNPSHYTRGIAEIDRGLQQLTSAIDASPRYRDQTLIVVVPDCGRDSNPFMRVPYQHHFNSRSAHEIWALLVGPGVCQRPRLRSSRQPDRRHQDDRRADGNADAGGGRQGAGMTTQTMTTVHVVTRPFVWLVSVVLALVATQSALLSVILLGYVYASMHRYLVGDELGDTFRERVWQRVKLGVAGWLTMSSLALLPGILWAGAWWAGWDNSFNKGYEQASVGPLVGVGGVVLFLLLMPYLQIAQARHAETLDWRCVYRFRENLKIWTGAPFAAALLPIALWCGRLRSLRFVLAADISTSDDPVRGRHRSAVWSTA